MLSRQLSTIQKRENLNKIYATDLEGPDGVNNRYHIVPVFKNSEIERDLWSQATSIQFQCGPRKDLDSTHGIIDSDLLEIVRDRLKAFQAGPYSTDENAHALIHIEEALMWLNRRAEDRIEKNVLGIMEQ